MSLIDKLTSDYVERNLAKEGAALKRKWAATGLLKGLKDEAAVRNMVRLLENQAGDLKRMKKAWSGGLLQESTTMASGDIEGFATVAFPMVRRVFAKLVANDLVAVQPMSLPNGLIFFLDFKYGTSNAGNNGQYVDGYSVYGQGVLGSQVTGGVNLTGRNAEAGFYNLNQGYSSPLTGASAAVTVVASGTVGGAWTGTLSSYGDKLVQFDPDLSGTLVCVGSVNLSAFSQLNRDSFITLTITSSLANGTQARRMTAYHPTDRTKLLVVTYGNGSDTANQLSSSLAATLGFQYAATDNFVDGVNGLGSVAGAANWLFESDVTTVSGNFGDLRGEIPEIDIKVDSINVTAITRKLRAKWSTELGQDLVAYHSVDPEQELTEILSEHIGLEIDREILGDLVRGATGSTKYWSRRVGQYLDDTGAVISNTVFYDNVSNWYETLVEKINDVSAEIHRKTLRGGANFIVCAPQVANILEFTAGFKASVLADEDKGNAGAVNVGSISKKFEIFVQADFLEPVILVGRKGKSFLESGYVYAPYVPLQVSPTIFGTEDFAPRKMVHTRYAKKMVRPDMYGLVLVKNLRG